MAARKQTSAGGAIPNLYRSYAYFPIWSPDGRYFITPTYYGGWSAPADAIASTTLQQAGLTITPALPAASAALQHIYALGLLDIFLAWSPDGKRLAVAAPGPGEPSDPVTVYDSATGGTLASLQSATLDADLAQETANSTGVISEASVFVRWSPDGSHLLLWDANVGTLTIWGPQQLGAGGKSH